MKKTFTLFVASMLLFGANAQNTALQTPKPTVKIQPEMVRNLIADQEAKAQGKVGPSWFGVNLDYAINFKEFEVDNSLKSGVHTYQVTIEATDAKSLNYQFNEISLPLNSQIDILDYRENLLQTISGENLQNTSFYNTFPTLGNKQIIRLTLPANNALDFSLKLSKVTYGYKAGNASCSGSGACNIPANSISTPTIDNAENSVGIILVGNSGYCTGTLINNPKENGKPYFLTANHCLTNSVSSWSFGFKYHSCDGEQAEIPTILNGATLIANNEESDFALLQINSTPTLADNVFYSGWDRSDKVPTGTTIGLHHPNGAPMKISTNTDALIKTTYQEEPSEEQTWRIVWEEGTTQGGSSGSGLFDATGKVVGHLVGGTAACSGTMGNNKPDYYGRIGVGFNEADPSRNLQPWLNPGYNTNGNIAGYNPNTAKTGFDAFVSLINNINQIECYDQIYPSFRVYNNGAVASPEGTARLYIDNVLVKTENIAALAANTESQDFGTPGGYFAVEGNHTLEIIVAFAGDKNSLNDTSRYEFTTRPRGIPFNLELTLDDYGSETKWEIVDGDNNVIHKGGPYADDLGGSLMNIPLCINEGCYTLNFTDTYGDGLCCDTPGKYELYNQHQDVVTSGWNTPDNSGNATTESTTFCAIYDKITELDVNQHFNIYPNPSTGSFNVSNAQNLKSIKIYTYDGKLIGVYAATAIVDANLRSGFYQLVLQTLTGELYTKSLIVK